MARTIILIHGRATKPAEPDLKGLWLEALRHGLERDHSHKVAEFDRANIEFVYYGDISNSFLAPEGHDLASDLQSRRITLDELKAHSKEKFFDESIYNSLPGKTSAKEAVVDALAGITSFLGISQPLISAVTPDMREYWNPESQYGSDVRYPIIKPLRKAMDAGDVILVIAHSLGTMIAYDTFWKFCRMGEYRPEYTNKKIDLFISIGSPLGDETVKQNLKGSNVNGFRRYPSNIRRWVNIAAEDDYVSHDQRIADDYRDMVSGLVDSIEDRRIYNLSVREGKSNPHHGVGYLIHPALAQTLADWL